MTASTTGQTLAQGNIGEIEVRGPNVVKGYWNMPEKTAEELRSDGFFITGDLGMVDADGYVHIVGRNKDLIISGGFNVYPTEIERVLLELDTIEQVSVVGLPDDEWGEVVVAVVIGAADWNDVQRLCNDKLAPYKRPRHLVHVSEFPRNAMGKVQKSKIRVSVQESLG